MRLLIVEDNVEFRTTVISYIKRQCPGLEIFEASSGEMGVTKASCVKPDILIIDINLPKANGFETMAVIKEDFPSSDIIILTMFDVTPFRKLSKSMGAVDFIGKTEVYERLVPALKKCIDTRNLSKLTQQ